jgi:hypothetical protein
VIPLAHVGGMPVEEFLPALASTGASLLAARAWLNRRRRHTRDEEPRG